MLLHRRLLPSNLILTHAELAARRRNLLAACPGATQSLSIEGAYMWIDYALCENYDRHRSSFRPPKPDDRHSSLPTRSAAFAASTEKSRATHVPDLEEARSINRANP